METPTEPSAPAAAPASPRAIPRLAVASLVLGIAGLVGSFLVVGGILGLVGLLLGGWHLARRPEARLLGWCGVWVSSLAVVAAAGFFTLYFNAIRGIAGQQADGFGGGTSGFAEWRGREAPDFEIVTLDGTRFRLADLKGRRVVLDFWATWCPPCVREIPHFIQLRQDLPEDAVAIVGLSREDRTVLKPFAAAKGVNYPIASTLDSELPAPFSGVRSIPTTFFLDRDGRIEEVVVGYHDYEALRSRAAPAAGNERAVEGDGAPQ